MFKLDPERVYLPLFVDHEAASLIGFAGLTPDEIKPITLDQARAPEMQLTLRLEQKDELEKNLIEAKYISFAVPTFTVLYGGLNSPSSLIVDAEDLLSPEDALFEPTVHQAPYVLGGGREQVRAHVGQPAFARHMQRSYPSTLPNGRTNWEMIMAEILSVMGANKEAQAIFEHNKAVLAFEAGIKEAFELKDAKSTDLEFHAGGLYEATQQAVAEVRAVTGESGALLAIRFKNGTSGLYKESEVMIITDAWPFYPAFYPAEVKYLISYNAIQEVTRHVD